LLVVEVGHSDTGHTTCLNVPSIGLVVVWDVAYNDVHLYLAESNAQTRHEWISALDKIESLKPHVIRPKRESFQNHIWKKHVVASYDYHFLLSSHRCSMA